MSQDAPGPRAPGLIDRAYQLAKSGDCRSLAEVKRNLSREGYRDVHAMLDGPSIRKALQKLIRGEPERPHPNDGAAADR